MADNPRVNLTQRLMCKALINHFNRLEMEDPRYVYNNNTPSSQSLFVNLPPSLPLSSPSSAVTEEAISSEEPSSVSSQGCLI